MKLFFIIGNESTFTPLMFEKVIDGLLKTDGIEISGIANVPFLSPNKFNFNFYKFMLNFYGIKGFFIKGINYSFCKLMAYINPKIRIYRRCFSIKELAEKYNIYYCSFNNPNNKKLLTIMKENKIDLIISGQGHLLKKEIITIPKIGIIGKHAGMLPKYKGIYPVFWAMLNDEKYVGMSIYYINNKYDEGDIILQKEIPIKKEDTFDSLYEKIHDGTPSLLVRAVKIILYNNCRIKRIDIDKGSYFGLPTKSDINKFKKKGGKII